MQARKRVDITLRSKINKFQANLSCLVTDHTSIARESNQGERRATSERHTIGRPRVLQVLKGGFARGSRNILRSHVGRIKGLETQPTWQKTLLGWIISGNLVATDHRQKNTVCGLVVNEQLNVDLTKF